MKIIIMSIVVSLIVGYCLGFKGAQVHSRYTSTDNQGRIYVLDTSFRGLWPWEYKGWPIQFWPLAGPNKKGESR